MASPSEQVTVAEALAQALRRAGVARVFGLPGGETAEVLDSLRRAGLEFLPVHHEASAVYMAEATARLTGRPGAALATLGPGATNALAGAAHAWLDRAPVLILTARVPQRLLPLRSHQHVDLAALFGPVTKASLDLRARGAAATVEAALALAQRARPGPVHLQVANEEAARPVVEGPPALEAPRMLPPPDEAALEAARAMLARARRPVLVAGLGLEPEAPYTELRRLAEAAAAPVVLTPKAKGALPADHPLFAGVVGLTMTDPVYEVLEEADLVLAVGFDVVELVRPWVHPAPLVWLAPWPNEDPRLPAAVEWVGPLAPALAELARGPFGTAPDWGERRVRRHREAHHARSLPRPAAGRLAPQAVLEAVRAAVPPEAVVTTDVGSHKILAALEFPALRPNTYLVANGLSPMGYGLPAAVAAALVDPTRPVVCLTGDGGLLMALGEMRLLSDLQAPLAVVVFRDDAFDLIRSHQVRQGKPVFGTEFAGPDFVTVARGFGVEACRVEDHARLAEALTEGLASGRPLLVEVLVDPRLYPTTPQALGGPG